MAESRDLIATSRPPLGSAGSNETGSLVAPVWHSASVEFAAGPVRYNASARITTGGLLAVGAMVSGILLSTAVVVWAATSAARERERRRR